MVTAAAYLREIDVLFPEGARALLREAAALYDEEVAAMEALRELNADEDLDLKEGAEVLSGALDQERAALAKLQQVLQES